MWRKRLVKNKNSVEELEGQYDSVLYLAVNKTSTLDTYYSEELISQVRHTLFSQPYGMSEVDAKKFFDALAAMWTVLNVSTRHNNMDLVSVTEKDYIQDFSTTFLRNIVDHKVTLSTVVDFTYFFHLLLLTSIDNSIVSDTVVVKDYGYSKRIRGVAQQLSYLIAPYIIVLLRYHNEYDKVFSLRDVDVTTDSYQLETFFYKNDSLRFFINFMVYDSMDDDYSFILNLSPETVTVLFDYCSNNKMFDTLIYKAIKHYFKISGDYENKQGFVDELNIFCEETFNTLKMIGDEDSQPTEYKQYFSRMTQAQEGTKVEHTSDDTSLNNIVSPYHIFVQTIGLLPGVLENPERLEEFYTKNLDHRDTNDSSESYSHAVNAIMLLVLTQHADNDYSVDDIFEMLTLIGDISPKGFSDCKNTCQFVVENYHIIDADTMKSLLCD